MKSEDFKIKCWIPDNNIMIYSDIDYEQYFITIDKFGVNVYYTPLLEIEKNIIEYIQSFGIIESIPMLALPVKDCEGNQIYDNDILECTWSDYWDPYGNKHPRDYPIRFIADVHDAYCIPENSKIVGNKYQNEDLYRQILWDMQLKDKWQSIRREAFTAEKEHTNWRKGQTLFNVFSAYYPKIAEQIIGTEYDCFNDDSKIDVFKERVIDLWIKEIE